MDQSFEEKNMDMDSHKRPQSPEEKNMDSHKRPRETSWEVGGELPICVRFPDEEDIWAGSDDDSFIFVRPSMPSEPKTMDDWTCDTLEKDGGRSKSLYFRIQKSKGQHIHRLDTPWTFYWYRISDLEKPIPDPLSPITTMPSHTPEYCTVAAMGSQIFAAGGKTRQDDGSKYCKYEVRNTVYIYDTLHPERNWSQGAPMVFERCGSVAFPVDGKLYVAGGDLEYWDNTFAEVFDPLLDKWESLPQPSYYLSDIVPNPAPVIDCHGGIHIVFYQYGDRALSSYNTGTNSWDMFYTPFHPGPTKFVALNAALYYYKHPYVLGYDLIKNTQFSSPVLDLGACPAFEEELIYLLHIGDSKLCFITSQPMPAQDRVTIDCKIFTVPRNGKNLTSPTHVQHTVRFTVDGSELIDCLAI